MTTLDLHPEDLFDKEEEGTLSPSEASRLESHVARCATCRFERAARGDFRAELAAMEQPVRLPSLAGVLEHATRVAPLSDAEPVAPAPSPGADRVVAVPRARRRTWEVVLLSAAALMLASGAAASLSKEVRTRVSSLFVTEAPSSVSPLRVTPSTPSPRPASAPAPLEPVIDAPAPSTSAAGPSVEPVAALAAPAVQATPSVHLAARSPSSARRVSPPAIAPAPPSAPPPAIAPEHEPARDASAIFAGASEARSRGDRARAVALYRELQHAHPMSREAQVSRAALGRVLLDQGDASGALAAFEAYLAQGAGPLEEEALVGQALALERMGRATDEGRAWSALLRAHPESPHVARARARLEALGIK